MTDKQLIRFAQSFRDGILDGEPSVMMCAAVSWPLAGLLRQSGGVEQPHRPNTGGHST
jgi:hypothetical protein